MDDSSERIVVAQMHLKERQNWTSEKNTKGITKRLLRNTGIFAAVSLCIGTGVYFSVNPGQRSQSVMSHLSAGFEFDDSLGRLQFVSNILPESAMVFLSDHSEMMMKMPTTASQTHAWSGEEPWIEYACTGDVSACCDGEIMTVVKNRQGEYTVRILHENGYESVYSGLNTVYIEESEQIDAGETVGRADGFAAFELRKEGLSIMPVFAGQ